MMWRSKKKAAEVEERATEPEKPEKEEVTEELEETDATKTNTNTNSSFIKSLWQKTIHKDKGEGAKENGDSEVRDESEPAENSKESSAENGEAPKKPRWRNLFRGKGNTEEEAIEVEVKGDSTLQIHDSTRNVSRSSSSIDPNRPSVYDEALEMLTGSLLIYIFADLREMVKEGKITAPELLEDPTPVRQVMQAIMDHKEALEERAIDHEKLSARLSALKEVHEQSAKAQATGETAMIGQLLQGGVEAVLSAVQTQESLSKTKESVLHQFHDENTTQGVVYGIALNHLRKRVTVVFRGSVTQQDFLTDSRSAQKKVDNPVASLVEEAPQHVQIHTGFYTYLFAEDKDAEKLRCERILDDAKKLLKENPGYRLYCTGHSLGGALATLCGFYAAVDDELIENGPVVVISVASPQVGHATFCESFHALERLGRLQHLRVANREDMITHLPFVHIKAHVLSPVAVAMFGAGNLYKHCGIHLELKSVEEENERKTQHFVCHPKSRCADKESYSEEWKRAMDAAKMLYESVVPLGKGDVDALTGFHSCTEYEARLMASKEYLSTVTLDELYRDEGIVGAALAKNLSEQILPEA